MRNLRLLFLLFLTVCSIAMHAQTTYPSNYPSPNDPMRKNVTPAPPDAYQLMKYGEYPVSRETGVPNISIPIYTITAGDISAPINLSYHAGGVKIDEKASWVGLGWTLNSGGMISRTIKGLADECGGGILFQHLPYYDANGVIDFSPSKIDVGNDDHYMNLMRIRTRQGADVEPDVFNFNFGGYAGKFFLDPKTKSETQCKGITQPKSDIDIQVFFTDITFVDRRITSIVAKTPDGNKYTFEYPCLFGDGTTFGNAAWYLSTITSTNDTDLIKFFYIPTPVKPSIDNFLVESTSIQYNYPNFGTPVLIAPTRGFASSGAYTGMMTPEHIEFPTGKVVFNSTNDRIDDDVQRLTSIDIIDKTQAAPIKSFVFGNNAYFTSHELSPGSLQLTDANKKRLKLASLQEVGMNGESNPPYQFTYLETGLYQLPPRHSCAQDYWGYYNGVNSNFSLIPLINLPSTLVPYWSFDGVGSVNFGSFPPNNVMGSANREPNGDYMKCGTISTIKFPTGGSTLFEFEPNNFLHSFVQQNVSTSDTHYSAAVTPPSPREVDSPIFTPDQNYQTTFTFSITYIGQDPNNKPVMTAESVYVDFFDITLGTSACRREVQYLPNTNVLFVVTAGHQYQLRTHSDFTDIVVNADLTWHNPPATPTTPVTENKVVGGLRIKQISDYDYDGKLASVKTYDYNSYKADDTTPPDFTQVTTRSSGYYNTPTLPDPLGFVSTNTYGHYYDGGSHTEMCEVYDYWFSASAYPSDQIGFPVGNVVTYEYVTERVTNITDNSQGRSIFNYDAQTTDFPFVAFQNSFEMDRSWLRGQPLHEYYFDKSNNLLKQVDYTYEVVDFPTAIIRGLKIDKYINIIAGAGDVCLCDYGPWACTPTTIYNMRHGQLRLSTYDEPIQWKRLVSKTETLDGISQTTTLEYQPQALHQNILAVQTTDSKNQVNRTETRYAQETNNTQMLSRNMTGIPLESDSKTDVTGNNTLAGGSRLTYGTLNGLFVPIRFEERLTDGSYRVTHEVNSVNATSGKIETFTSLDGLANGYKWGYNNEHPILKVTNAAAKDVFYSSFEDATGTADANSKTGANVYTISTGYPLSLSNLTSGSYVLTYWKRTSNVWALNSSVVNVAGTTYSTTIPASATVPIDEVRFYPANSQVTTYTYVPLVGVTSVTDANNLIQYYVYDNLGRLQFIKDNNGDIVKNFITHFKN